MPWTIDPDPLHGVALSALVAAIPIAFLFWALAWRGMKGHWASLGALALALTVAIAVYGMPARLALLAAADGAAFGLWPVSWIVVTALFVYRLSVESGDFAIIRASLAALTGDRRLQALLVAFSFGAFIEGCAGFGTPVAITASVLVGLGFAPIEAASLCLLANTAPVAFGAIGIPIIVAGQVSGVDAFRISQMAGRTLPIVTAIVPTYMLVVLCGWRGMRGVWPAAAVSGLAFALTQFATANWLGPMLPDIAASVVSIACLAALLRVWRPRDVAPVAIDAAAPAFSARDRFRAWAPFLLLTIVVAGWGVKPVRDLIDAHTTLKLPIPGLDQQVVRDGKPIAAVFKLDLLSAAGTAILLAGALAVAALRLTPAAAARAFARTVASMRWPMLGISAILAFSYVMNFAGMATTLGRAFAATGAAFPFFAAFLGWLGVFMTGSDTSANALFGKLQEVTANAIGVDPVVTVSANSVGGVCGKMISPQSLAVATASVGLSGSEGAIFRRTLPHSLVLTTLVAVIVAVQVRLFPGVIPPATAASTGAAAAVGTGTASACLAATLALAAIVAVVASTMPRRAPAAGPRDDAVDAAIRAHG